jgi:hypothetical protein
MKHGASAYRNSACRCHICREGNRVLQNRLNQQRRTRRVLIDGRLVAPLPADRHGRVSTYSGWGCQCEPCKQVGAAKNAQARTRRRAAA